MTTEYRSPTYIYIFCYIDRSNRFDRFPRRQCRPTAILSRRSPYHEIDITHVIYRNAAGCFKYNMSKDDRYGPIGWRGANLSDRHESLFYNAFGLGTDEGDIRETIGSTNFAKVH